MSRSFRIQELAEACGVKPRTIRYYVQRGLLPAPTFRGPETAYDQDHLVRLQAIKRLQERFWSLDAIATHLAELEGQAIETWLDRLEAESPPENLPSALSRLMLEMPGRAPVLELDTSGVESTHQGISREGDPTVSGTRDSAEHPGTLVDVPCPPGGSARVHYQLAPGLELQLDPERASDAARAFLEDVLDLARRYRLRSF